MAESVQRPIRANGVPEIIIDIRLSEPGEYCGGFLPFRGEKRERALEKEHLQLHKDGVRHINLDGSYDKCGHLI